MNDTKINIAWELIRDSILQSCEVTVGYLQPNRKKWMSEDTNQKVEQRREMKEKLF